MTHDASHKGGDMPAARPAQPLGELVPMGGGDPIPLLKPKLVVGRRESCDIVLQFPNVSGVHCELSIDEGHWVVQDLGSSNGTKVNGSRVTRQQLDSGDRIAFGRNAFEIFYSSAALGAAAVADAQQDVFATSLLSAAGLERRRSSRDPRPRQ
jgi:adenylate cyclase